MYRYANILTTVRNVANRVVILSGVISGGRTGSSRLPSYNSKTTLVLMMCVRKIREFTNKMMKDLGYPSDLGVAVVHKMSLHDQIVLRSDVENIADVVRDQEMSSPAVFVIGNVTKDRFGNGVYVMFPDVGVDVVDGKDEAKFSGK
jgi:siroheme synthase